ncbi:MAG: hypothetical protein K5662_02845 [Lachnospiraceae bacterium]|nr:hypothetical protein [Lachnospiraceae bacterium]
MRIWVKEIKDNHLIRDMVVEDYGDDTRTHKVMTALSTVCDSFDLGHPIWLDSNIKEFQLFAKTRFLRDSFVEPIDFDYLEFGIIEE